MRNSENLILTGLVWGSAPLALGVPSLPVDASAAEQEPREPAVIETARRTRGLCVAA